jgi:hypothetical protein
MVLDLLGRGSAEHKERGVLNRPGSESATGRVGGETPPTREKVIFLDLRSNGSTDALRWTGDLTYKVHLFFVIFFLFCPISI